MLTSSDVDGLVVGRQRESGEDDPARGDGERLPGHEPTACVHDETGTDRP